MSKIQVDPIPIDQWDEWEKAVFEELTDTTMIGLAKLFDIADTFDQDDPTTYPDIPQKVMLGMLWVPASRKIRDQDLTLKRVALEFEYKPQKAEPTAKKLTKAEKDKAKAAKKKATLDAKGGGKDDPKAPLVSTGTTELGETS